MEYNDTYIICPCCQSDFKEASKILDEQRLKSKVIDYNIKYKIKCPDCKTEYAVKGDVPSLIVSDNDSFTLLKELVQYYDFYHRIKNHRIEHDRLNFKKEEISKNLKLYKHAFEEGIKRINFPNNPLILDVGAGMCETSYVLASKGANVIATDLSPLDFFDPRFFSLHNKELESFNQVFEGVDKITPENINFQRVLCSAERLPFRDRIFDVVFFRSILHHAISIKRMLNEASRVLKPGGQLIIVSEPHRPILEPEIKFLEPIIDYQEGIGERYLRFKDYEGNFKCNGFKYPEVQIFIPYYGTLAYKIAKMFGRDINPDFWHNKVLNPWEIKFRLPLLCTALNMYSSKIKDVAKIQKPLNNKEDVNIENSLSVIVVSLETKITKLRKIIRENIPAEDLRYNIKMGKNELPVGAKGWRNSEKINGIMARYAYRDAFCVLDNITKSENLKLKIFYPGPESTDEKYFKPVFDLYVNDNNVLHFEEDFNGWKEISVPIKNIPDRILELRIKQNDLLRLKDGREVGIAIDEISFL